MNIAIIGKMASGKTTCKNFLMEQRYYTGISLAEPIYWIVNNLNNKTSSTLYYEFIHPHMRPPLDDSMQSKFINIINQVREIPEEFPKPRKRLQWFGTEGGRTQIRDTIWIDILLERIKQNPIDSYVIDDVRFRNELAALKKVGFFTIKLEVDSKTQEERILRLYGKFDKSILTHGSEIEIDGLEGNIYLDATVSIKQMLEDLDKAIKGGP